ncbi:hypothetical protein [Lacrimispora sphenoides]|uniref:Uncharacterized protein n=1 Tax=Lacrimispora sphenoides JCM 1415 TaxID=1297793 RepID=A0ABY1C3V8_9FIRM|nr:hypothetical protein [Lacrimispora sphenoides]SET62160.1 hypothetical protein SAMN02745906_0725 [[Clostridium] sphenoides JCM 1415]SUY50109.1 Uncharacterised protein [Lacrimispora sphenoides]
MKKKILGLVFSAMLASSLIAGCSKNNSPAKETSLEKQGTEQSVTGQSATQASKEGSKGITLTWAVLYKTHLENRIWSITRHA